MAFNFGGFVAGVSEKIVERVETEEDRLAEIAKEQRLLSNRLAFDRQSERRKKKAAVEELTGTLKMLGMEEDTIASIAGYGKGALTTAISHAETVYAQGGNINDVYTFNTSKDPTSIETQEVVDSVSSAMSEVEPEDIAIPDMKTGVTTKSIKAAGLTIDTEALKEFFPQEAAYSSVGAMEAGLLNLKYKANKRGDTTKEEEYTQQLDALYAHKKKLAAVARADEKDASFHTPSSATTLYKTFQRSAGDLIGAEQGDIGQIKGEMLGNPMITPLRDYMATSNMLSTSKDDKAITTLATGINNSMANLIKKEARVQAASLQQSAAYNKKTSVTGKTSIDKVSYFNFENMDASTFTPDQFGPQQKSNFDFGQTIIVKDNQGTLKLMVYTGVPNPLQGGSEYIVVQ